MYLYIGKQWFTSIKNIFPLFFLIIGIADLRLSSGLLWCSIALCTNSNTKRTIAHNTSAINYVRLLTPTLTIFIITSAISELMVETPIFAVISLSYSLTVAKTVEANDSIFFTIFFIILFHFCCSALAWLCHFCIALTVARKVRLCLHPRRMLRVQSLHLPVIGLGSALSAIIIIQQLYTTL